MSNLIKKAKCVGHGFRNFANYRIRVLLFTGQPDWSLLAIVKPLKSEDQLPVDSALAIAAPLWPVTPSVPAMG